MRTYCSSGFGDYTGGFNMASAPATTPFGQGYYDPALASLTPAQASSLIVRIKVANPAKYPPPPTHTNGPIPKVPNQHQQILFAHLPNTSTTARSMVSMALRQPMLLDGGTGTSGVVPPLPKTSD